MMAARIKLTDARLITGARPNAPAISHGNNARNSTLRRLSGVTQDSEDCLALCWFLQHGPYGDGSPEIAKAELVSQKRVSLDLALTGETADNARVSSFIN